MIKNILWLVTVLALFAGMIYSDYRSKLQYYNRGYNTGHEEGYVQGYKDEVFYNSNRINGRPLQEHCSEYRLKYIGKP